MPIRLKYLDFAILVATVLSTAFFTYGYYRQRTTDSPASEVVAANVCMHQPVAVPKSGWDSTATVPGTNVSFLYPQQGFYGNVPKLEQMAEKGFSRGSISDAVRPTDGPGNEPSFEVSVSYREERLGEQSMREQAVVTEDNRRNDETKRIENIKGRLFLIFEGGSDRHLLIAETPYSNGTITVSSRLAAFTCIGQPEYNFRQLFTEFLEHLDFGDAPAP